jgi:hypothetical protein
MRGNPVLAQRALWCTPGHPRWQGEYRMAVSDAKLSLIGELRHRLDDLRRFL